LVKKKAKIIYNQPEFWLSLLKFYRDKDKLEQDYQALLSLEHDYLRPFIFAKLLPKHKRPTKRLKKEAGLNNRFKLLI
jgi:hypothetical protein